MLEYTKEIQSVPVSARRFGCDEAKSMRVLIDRSLFVLRVSTQCQCGDILGGAIVKGRRHEIRARDLLNQRTLAVPHRQRRRG